MAKFYISDLSPFGARLRLVMALTGQSYTIELPPGGSGSAQMKAINGFGRTPVYEADDGRIISESMALMEFLAEKAPASGLIPTDAETRAKMRNLILAFDFYVLGAMAPVFQQMRSSPPDVAIVKQAFVDVGQQLDTFAGLLEGRDYALGESITLADLAMVPFGFVMGKAAGAFGVAAPISANPRLAGWWDTIRANDHVRAVLDHMEGAFARAFGPKS